MTGIMGRTSGPFAAQKFSETETIVVVGAGEYSDFHVADVLIGPIGIDLDIEWRRFGRTSTWEGRRMADGKSFWDRIRELGFRRMEFIETCHG